METRRRRSRDADSPRRRVAATPRPRRGNSVETGARLRYRGKTDFDASFDAALEKLEAKGQPCGAFFVESGASVAGVVVAPPGYMKRCYEKVRSRGGLCVADEVQTGLGRLGKDAWYRRPR